MVNATISFTAGGLMITSSPFNIPAPIYSVLNGVNAASGKFSFTFTNITGLSYSVLATNLLSAPLATWPVIGTTTESPLGSGTYGFHKSRHQRRNVLHPSPAALKPGPVQIC